jgi:hypothetical protein
VKESSRFCVQQIVGNVDGVQVTVTRGISAKVEMPESWVPRLSVPRDVLDMRVPKGSKKTVYQYSELEVFALFGEAAKFDGCLQRLSFYEDLDHQIKLQVLFHAYGVHICCSWDVAGYYSSWGAFDEEGLNFFF